jgi:hypothetical protein
VHRVHLSEELFQQAERRAAQAGFPTVDDYIADVVQHDLSDAAAGFDHLFTPERLAHLDRAAAEMDAGQGLTVEQADAVLARRREEWLRQNPR